MAMQPDRGFTLIELVAVIVVLAVVGASYATLFTGMSGARGTDVGLQTAAQVGQGCAEHILGLRRHDTTVGYNNILVGGTRCGAAFASGGFTPTDVTVAYVGAACPAGANCKQVTITTTDGSTTHTVDLMLADY